MPARTKRLAGKRKQQETSKVPYSTTSGNEVDRREGLRAERRMMVEGKKYVRHPEDDATFLVSSTLMNLLWCWKEVVVVVGEGWLQVVWT